MTDAPTGNPAQVPGAGDLARLVGDTRTDDAVRGRARERSLRQLATEEASLVGLLLDLAEEGAEVSVRTRAGRSVQGRLAGLGRDFVAVEPVPGAPSYVPLVAISAVRRRPDRGANDPTGERTARGTVSLAAHLAGLAPERPRVAVAVDGEEALLSGELRAVGLDVATIRVDGNPPTTAYVSLAAVSVVAVLASG